MENIIGIIDAQGFVINGKFYARECAVVGNNICVCQEFNPNINWNDLNGKDKSTVIFCKHKFHGLTLNSIDNTNSSQIPKSNELENFIINCWHFAIGEYENKDKILFGVKNNELKKILDRLEIPNCNLNQKELDFPSLNDLDKNYDKKFTCGYHVYRNVTCAYRKVLRMWSYLRADLLELDDPFVRADPLELNDI